MSRAAILSIRNATARPRLVLLEPWGREFLLDSEEKLEIVGRPGPGGAGLRVVESERVTVVYVENASGVRAIKDGMGHDLDPPPVARTIAHPVPPADGGLNPMWDRDMDG